MHPAQPVVSVVIAAGRDLAHLQRCVEGLLGNTSYQSFEILFIEQPDSTADVKGWLAQLASMQEAKLRVFSTSQNNLASQLNEVQQHAIGDYLLFLSADTAVVSEHWLDELLNHAQRGEVGVVGAKLFNADGQIAHAGHVLGLEGPVGSPFVGAALNDPGYMQRLQVDQNLSAVGSECLMVLRELFVQLEGFDTALASAYMSPDLCLRAAQAGFLTVWTPHAQLMLDKEKQEAPDNAQQDAMYEKWLPQLARDAAYNPTLSLAMPGGYKLADSQISWRPLDGFRPAPVALVHPLTFRLWSLSGYAAFLGNERRRPCWMVLFYRPDACDGSGTLQPDTIILQRQICDERLEAMRRCTFSRHLGV